MKNHKSSRRARAQFQLESLEIRALLSTGMSDFIMLGATATSLTAVTIEYNVSGMDITENYPIAIYRSANPAFEPMADTLLGTLELTPAQLTVGTHLIDVPLNAPRPINPSLPFILAIGDPQDAYTESVETNNLANFRVWTIGAVTHGYQIDGQFPAWVPFMASSLETTQGYDLAIAWNWAEASRLPVEGVATAQGALLASNIVENVDDLFIDSNDVVDLHLIGFSRGSVVVTTAAGLTPTSAPYAGGNVKLTLLDPHPARNDVIPYYSVSTGPFGQLALFNFLTFQEATNDPALIIPDRVTQAESFYQNALITDALRIIPDEVILMSWGNVPIATVDVLPTYYNLTAVAPTHEGMPLFYQEVVVPTLGTNAPLPPIVPPPVINPPAPTNGGPAFPSRRQGTLYELNFATNASTRHHVAAHLIHSTQHLNRWILAGQTRRANTQLNNLIRFVTRQRGNTIPAPLADSLLRLYNSTSLILNPPPLPTASARSR